MYTRAELEHKQSEYESLALDYTTAYMRNLSAGYHARAEVDRNMADAFTQAAIGLSELLDKVHAA